MGTISDAMRSDFIAVAPEDTLGEVAQKMVEAKTGAVAVLDYGRLVGILTERDMLKAMAGRVLTSDARAREWMTPDPITAAPDLPLEEAQANMRGFAAAMFASEQFGAAPGPWRQIGAAVCSSSNSVSASAGT